MFLAVIFILIGLFMLLNAFGIITGNFWGIVWAVVFIAIGLRLMLKRGMCPMCGWHFWEGKMHNKMHEKMEGHCCDHDHDANSQDNH